jgi:hypothetical protein
LWSFNLNEARQQQANCHAHLHVRDFTCLATCPLCLMGSLVLLPTIPHLQPVGMIYYFHRLSDPSIEQMISKQGETLFILCANPNSNGILLRSYIRLYLGRQMHDRRSTLSVSYEVGLSFGQPFDFFKASELPVTALVIR